VPKIIEKYGKEAFVFRQNSTVVTIPFDRLNLGTGLGENPQVGEQFQNDDAASKIIDFCSVARSRQELIDFLKYKDRKTLRKRLKPLIEQGRIAMTIPDKPNSSKQKYIAIK